LRNVLVHLRRGFRAQSIDKPKNFKMATNFEFCTAPLPSSAANGHVDFYFIDIHF